MTGAIRAEFRKFFTTRLWWGMAIAVVVSAAAFAVLFAWVFTSDMGGPETGAPTGSPTQIANSVYTAGLSVGYLLMLTIGIMQIGMEYRHRTITSTFLALPKRWQPMLAKVISLLVIGAGYGLLSLIGSVSLGAVMLKIFDADPFPSSAVFRTLALSLLVLGLWALIGLGVGILIPNQIAALLIGVGAAWIVEPILGLALSFWDFGRDHIAPYLPSSATNAVVDAVTQSPDQVTLDWWVAAIVLAGWAAVLAGFGIFRTMRQDIS